MGHSVGAILSRQTMGLGDRDYMRDPGDIFRGRPRAPRSITVTLLIINVVVFFLQAVFYGYPPDFTRGVPLALRVDQLLHGYIWQLVTYQFLHGGFLHLLLNCWALFVFGREVEATIGRKPFLALYLLSGVVGGLLQVFYTLPWPSHFGIPTVGASAGVFGLVAAFAALFPNRTLTILLFFVIPVSIRAKNLLFISGLIAIFGILFPGGSVAHAAHLGGMLVGMFGVTRIGGWLARLPRRSGGPKKRRFIEVMPGKPASWRKKNAIDVEDLSSDDFLTREVDPILEKISAHGIHSLTERERKILEEARARMGKH